MHLSVQGDEERVKQVAVTTRPPNAPIAGQADGVTPTSRPPDYYRNMVDATDFTRRKGREIHCFLVRRGKKLIGDVCPADPVH
jgi:hypothetical protein